jgi:hypothetical protein
MNAVSIIEGTLGSIAAAALYDWLSITRSAAFYTDFDYRYFPLSKMRMATLGLVAAAFLFAFLSINPANPPMLPLVLAGVALAIHGVVGQVDLLAQRRTGYRTPLNYGEREG